MSSQNLAVWPANRKPTRLTIVLAVLFILQSYLFFSATDTPVSWTWAITGFVGTALAMGPVAASPAGKRLGELFEAIGAAWRTVAILVAVAVIWAAETAIAIPTVPAMNLLTGGMVAIGVIVLLEAIRARVIPR